MNFTLDIPERNGIWRPGQTVHGVARFTPGREGETAEIKSVRVEFTGELRTEAAFYYGFVESGLKQTVVPLFKEELVLFRGPYKVGTAQEWPFTLHIPPDCRFAQPRILEIPQSEQSRFDASLPQRLPPSMHAEMESKEGHKSCTIRYRVTGQVETKSAIARDLECIIELRVIPDRLETERNRRPKFIARDIDVSIASAQLDAAASNRGLTLKEKLKARMSRPPSVNFKLRVQLPDAGVMFDPSNVRLSIDQSGDAPTVLLKSFSVQLLRNIAQVTHRTDGPHAHHWRHPDPITIARWQGSMSVEGLIDLNSLYTYKESDWDRAAPNFRTFACAQTWTLLFTATIEVARKEQVITAQQPSFTLLSPFVDEYVGLTREEAAMINIDDAPPGYGGNAPAYTA